MFLPYHNLVRASMALCCTSLVQTGLHVTGNFATYQFMIKFISSFQACCTCGSVVLAACLLSSRLNVFLMIIIIIIISSSSSSSILNSIKFVYTYIYIYNTSILYERLRRSVFVLARTGSPGAIFGWHLSRRSEGRIGSARATGRGIGAGRPGVVLKHRSL